MELDLIRGDTCWVVFRILDDDGAAYVLKEGDRLYFTVKKYFELREAVLQKTYGDGISYDAGAQEYGIALSQEDTLKMEQGRYVYDIKIIIDLEGEKVVETLTKGFINVGINATHKENE